VKHEVEINFAHSVVSLFLRILKCLNRFIEKVFLRNKRKWYWWSDGYV